MQRYITGGFIRLFVIGAIAFTAQAQWLNYPTPGIPRTADGKPNLTAPGPRTGDGKPDLTGVWRHEVTTAEEMKRLYGKVIEDRIQLEPAGMEIGTQHKYGLNILVDFKPGESPLRPEAEAVMKQRAAERNARPGNPSCDEENRAWPWAGLASEPIKIVQATEETIVLYEVGNLHRQIFADGREFPAEFDLPAYLGYSIGHWEGDTFVVETRGFNGKTVLDAMGHPRSDATDITERFHRRDFGHLDYEITFNDPRFYTRKFTVRIPHELLTSYDIFEMFCENEKDAVHIPKR
jgi:hypothetical protein